MNPLIKLSTDNVIQRQPLLGSAGSKNESRFPTDVIVLFMNGVLDFFVSPNEVFLIGFRGGQGFPSVVRAKPARFASLFVTNLLI